MYKICVYMCVYSGPYTILAPTNAAWSKLSSQELEGVLGDAALLKDVLQYHVVQGEVFSWDLPSGRVLTTLGGHAVRVYHTGQVRTAGELGRGGGWHWNSRGRGNVERAAYEKRVMN